MTWSVGMVNISVHINWKAQFGINCSLRCDWVGGQPVCLCGLACISGSNRHITSLLPSCPPDETGGSVAHCVSPSSRFFTPVSGSQDGGETLQVPFSLMGKLPPAGLAQRWPGELPRPWVQAKAWQAETQAMLELGYVCVPGAVC